MGFNKRHINDDGIIARYKEDGIDSVKQYFSADALIINGDFAMEISDLIKEAMGDDEWNKLEEMIKKHIKDVEFVQ